MHTTPKPPHQNQSPQMLFGGWDALYESPFDVSFSPEELFDSRGSLATVYPETALMYAVLEDAFLCFQKQLEIDSPGTQRAAREAKEWFFGDDSDALFSFVSICAVLGLEPGCIRKKLKVWHQSRLDSAAGEI